MSARDELKAALYGHPQDESLLDAYRAEVLREGLTDVERQFLTFALNLAADEMIFSPSSSAEDEAALRSLRRMADETAPDGAA